MRILISVVLGLLGGPRCDKPAPAAAQADPAVIQWLDKLESKGREIRAFEAGVVYDKRDELLKDRQVRKGDLFYLAGTDQQPTRFAVIFRQFIADNKLVNEQLEYIFDGVWLVEKDHRQKRFEKRQVVAPGDKSNLNPLSIDGPFPLPLGQKRDRVLQRFEVTLVSDKPEPGEPERLHLRLTPRADAPAVRDQKKFDRVDLWFDRRTLAPVKVETDEGAVVTAVTLTDAKINSADAKQIAQLINTDTPREGEGWSVEVKRLDD